MDNLSISAGFKKFLNPIVPSASAKSESRKVSKDIGANCPKVINISDPYTSRENRVPKRRAEKSTDMDLRKMTTGVCPCLKSYLNFNVKSVPPQRGIMASAAKANERNAKTRERRLVVRSRSEKM
ncbi:OLC1v1036436C1 [Oldenlandia corymbosa var. corymbosa]|uniref:OLC1v1036436C1 n=1 Tax=Oldenlandia corymbosa var. corymbosa TaxID=529605 RepID=A0AAV1CWQ8_OLDCO|nr:OLC1v1036436C1 [Oldenlandia corymbosa var. corymbosa]